MLKFSDYSVCVLFHGNETLDRLKYMGYVPDMGLEVYGSSEDEVVKKAANSVTINVYRKILFGEEIPVPGEIIGYSGNLHKLVYVESLQRWIPEGEDTSKYSKGFTYPAVLYKENVDYRRSPVWSVYFEDFGCRINHYDTKEEAKLGALQTLKSYLSFNRDGNLSDPRDPKDIVLKDGEELVLVEYSLSTIHIPEWGKYWTPSLGEEYYYLVPYGHNDEYLISKRVNNGSEIDYNNLGSDVYNCFKTKEEAYAEVNQGDTLYQVRWADVSME